jgi:hypothetical protein
MELTETTLTRCPHNGSPWDRRPRTSTQVTQVSKVTTEKTILTRTPLTQNRILVRPITGIDSAKIAV